MRPRPPRVAPRLLLALVLTCAALPALADLGVAWAQDAEEGEAPPPPPEKPDPGKKIKIVLAYVLAIGGVLSVGLAAGETLRHTQSYPAAKLGLVHMIRQAPNNAEIMCRSRPGTFYEAIGAAFKTGALIGPADLSLYQTSTKPAYDGGAIGVTTKWKTLFGKAKLGGMAAAGGLALTATSGELPWPVVLCALLVLGGLARIYLHKAEMDRQLVLARAEVLPEVDAALVSGRYVFPPRPQA